MKKIHQNSVLVSELETLLTQSEELEVEAELKALADTLENYKKRSRLSAEHTVIGFFGATGSGKSSLFNRITKSELAKVAHKRPTTTNSLAAIYAGENLQSSGHELLDWLEIHDRVEISAGLEFEKGAIFVDVPDFDSIASEHREIAWRLAQKVDVLVWVSDVEKYADAALHHDFLKAFTAHTEVSLMVLNQVDRLAADIHPRIKQSLEEILKENSLGIEVLLTSATSGVGIDALSQKIHAAQKAKLAGVGRLKADAATAVMKLAPEVGVELKGQSNRNLLGKKVLEVRAEIPHLLSQVPDEAEERATEALAQAAQLPAITKAVGQSYLKQAGKKTGWPLTRWMYSLSQDPLMRMRIGRANQTHRNEDSTEEFISRSSLSLDAPQALAKINRGTEEYRSIATGQMSSPWDSRIRRIVDKESQALPDVADWVITHTDFTGKQRAWYFTALNIIQWLAFFTASLGLIWLVLYQLAGFFQFVLPKIEVDLDFMTIPLPTLLLVLGIAFGILIATGARFINALSAKRRAQRAYKILFAALKQAVHETLTIKVNREYARAKKIENSIGAILNS